MKDAWPAQPGESAKPKATHSPTYLHPVMGYVYDMAKKEEAIMISARASEQRPGGEAGAGAPVTDDGMPPAGHVIAPSPDDEVDDAAAAGKDQDDGASGAPSAALCEPRGAGGGGGRRAGLRDDCMHE
jgi:hypothetical protein